MTQLRWDEEGKQNSQVAVPDSLMKRKISLAKRNSRVKWFERWRKERERLGIKSVWELCAEKTLFGCFNIQCVSAQDTWSCLVYGSSSHKE